MRFLNLTVVSLAALLLQDCFGAVYIPPATAQIPKTQLIHVIVRGDYKFVYVNKINGITVMEPAVSESHYGAKVRPVDFYVVPGTYSVDYQKVRIPDSGSGSLFSTTTRPIFNNSGTAILGINIHYGRWCNRASNHNKRNCYGGGQSDAGWKDDSGFRFRFSSGRSV
jgi:hypothetical protein